MVWSSLGINYKGDITHAPEDAAYLKSVGINKVRIHVPNDGDTSFRAVAAYFKAQGFYTIYGITAGSTLTAANWSAYAALVVAEAAYCEANDVCDQFTLGGELHYKIDGTTLVLATLLTNIKTLAASVRAVYSGLIDYSSDVNDYTGWISAGLGNDIDIFGYHCYSNWTGKYLNETNMTTPIPLLVAAFPTELQINEFHIDSDSADILAMSVDTRVMYFRRMYAYLKASGAPSIFVFGFVGYKYGSDDGFSMKLIDGSYNDVWDVLLTNNGRRSFVNP